MFGVMPKLFTLSALLSPAWASVIEDAAPARTAPTVNKVWDFRAV